MLLPNALCPPGALHKFSQEEPEHPVQEMEANAAGAVQEAHHGAVWWRKPGLRTASHPCCPRLPVGVPLQTVTSLPYKVFIVLFFISRMQLLPSSGEQECLVKPAHHVVDAKTASLWLQIKAAPCFELKSCKSFKRHYHLCQIQAVSNWKESMHGISTYITSSDSTPNCTRTERLLGLTKHEKLENAALRENYRHSGDITEIIELVWSTVGSVARLWPPEEQKYLKVDGGRTLRGSTEWTFRNIQACWAVRLKPSQVGMSRIFFCSRF